MHWRRQWQPTPVFLPGESQGRGSLVGCRLWGRTESDTTEAMQQQQQHAILLFTASDLASITSHIHSWVLFLLWFHPFILSGVLSPLISSSILCTYRPGEFLFQYPIFLPFHTVHRVLRARILKWFAIPFSSGPHSVRPLQHDLPILGGPTWHGFSFIELNKAVVCVIRLTSFL